MRFRSSGATRVTVASLLFVLLLVAVGRHVARLEAQEPAAAPQPAAAPAPTSLSGDQSLRTLGREIFRAPRNFNDWIGLGFYIVLLVFSIICVTAALERLFNLRRNKIIPPGFVSQLRDLVRTGRDSKENLQSLADSSKAPIASVLKCGLLRAGRPLAEVEKGMEDGIAREVSTLRGRHRVLGVMGNVAPLVGLFGTVVGMIFAFQVTSEADSDKAELLAKGIYLALLTTAIGLTIAIPCILLVAWFNTQVERYMREIDEALLQTLPAFGRMEQSSAPREVAATNGASREPVHYAEERVPISAK